MVATPLTLADALNFNGYTIGQSAAPAFTIATTTGTMNVPAMVLSSLNYQRAGTASPYQSFYLDQLPMFAPTYRPVILSHILDQYSTRRIGYDTPDKFGLAVRRWMNRELGPQSILNRRYLSTAVALPLTTDDSTTDNTNTNTNSATSTNTDHSRDASSDFPQGQLAANLDYASSATDRNATAAGTANGTAALIAHGAAGGRSGVSVMALLAEQRAAFINADSELLDAIEPLFLGVWDRGELDTVNPNNSLTVTTIGYW